MDQVNLNENNPFRIPQWNAQSLNNKMGDLLKIACNYDIILITESFLKPDIPFKFPGFVLIRKDFEDQRGGGVAIAIKNNLKYKKIPNVDAISPNLYIRGVLLTTNKGELAIYGVYKKPGILISNLEWSNLFNFYPNAYASIIGGDLNIHSPTWGSGTNCRSGDTFLEALPDSNFMLMNDGSITRISRPNENPSAVDITLVTTNISLQSNWKVLKDAMGSDHYPIEVTINESPEKYHFFYHKIKLDSLDWKKFYEFLETKEDSLINIPDDLDGASHCESTIEIIMGAIDHAAPKKNSPRKSHKNTHNNSNSA